MEVLTRDLVWASRRLPQPPGHWEVSACRRQCPPGWDSAAAGASAAAPSGPPDSSALCWSTRPATVQIPGVNPRSTLQCMKKSCVSEWDTNIWPSGRQLGKNSQYIKWRKAIDKREHKFKPPLRVYDEMHYTHFIELRVLHVLPGEAERKNIKRCFWDARMSIHAKDAGLARRRSTWRNK